MEDDFLVEPAKSVADPRELLIGYLDAYRAAMLKKFDGMAEDEQRRSRLPSGWTPLELLNHLAHVERRWFRWTFLAEPAETLGDVFGDRDEAGERWVVAPTESVADVRALYVDECDRSRGIAAAAALDDVAAPGERFGPDDVRPTLAWIMFHLLQEYARHLGHLDIARELADGMVGQ